MKTFILSISKTYQSPHPRVGNQTMFKEKIINNIKGHTIRHNVKFWVNRINQINQQKGYLSLRQWQSIPYKSKSEEFLKLYKVGYEIVEKLNGKWYVGIQMTEIDANLLAKNDGLSLYDFNNWFKEDSIKDLIIIHFTPFHYYFFNNDQTLIHNTNQIEPEQTSLNFIFDTPSVTIQKAKFQFNRDY